MGLRQALIEGANRAGFPLAGALDIETALAPGGGFARHLARFDRWLAEGSAGEMSYLERGRERRADPRRVFPAARSILCVAIPYPRRAAGAPTPETGPRYARYLKARDYHREIAGRLEAMMAEIRRARAGDAGRGAEGEAPLEWKVCVDTSAVLERAWAALAGLGWIGKNSMLIHPKLGSHLFLAEVLINARVHHGPSPMPDLCGHCERCLSACPTGALPEPGYLDSNRCISYWTLEKRGALALEPGQRAAASGWIAGCDLCQEACPFNLKPSREPDADRPGDADGATAMQDWKGLLAESPESYSARVRDSALRRVKPGQFSRNLALSLGGAIAAGALPEARLRELAAEIARRSAAEPDPYARAEWKICAEALSRALQSPKRSP